MATPWKTQSNLNLILSKKFRRLFKAAEQASSTRDGYDTYTLCMAWFAGLFLYVAEKLGHLKVCVFLDDIEKDTVSYYLLGR